MAALSDANRRCREEKEREGGPEGAEREGRVRVGELGRKLQDKGRVTCGMRRTWEGRRWRNDRKHEAL